VALDALLVIAGNVATAFSERGRELWLLIDEVQGPVLGWELSGSVEDSDKIVQQLKKVRSAGAPAHARHLQDASVNRASRCPALRASVLPRSSSATAPRMAASS